LPLHIIPDDYTVISTTVIIAIVSLAMISTIKYDNLPRPSISLLKSRPIFSLLVFSGFIGSFLSKGALIFPSMLLYLVVGGIRYIHSIFSERSTYHERDTLEDPDENPFD
jgi:phosphatidylserine synthase